MNIFRIFIEAAVAAFNAEVEAAREEQAARRELAHLLQVDERDVNCRLALRAIEDLLDDASESAGESDELAARRYLESVGLQVGLGGAVAHARSVRGPN